MKYFEKATVIGKNNKDEKIRVGATVKNKYGHEGKVYYDKDRYAFMIKGSDADMAPIPFNEDFSDVEIIDDAVEF